MRLHDPRFPERLRDRCRRPWRPARDDDAPGPGGAPDPTPLRRVVRITGTAGPAGPDPGTSAPGAPDGRVHRARLRALPRRLRRREVDAGLDPSALLDGVGDPLGCLLALLVMVVVLAAPVLIGLALLPVELALLAVVGVVLVLPRLVGLLPWTVAVEELRDDRWVPVGRARVRGTREARRRRDELDARVRPLAPGQARAALDGRCELVG